MIQGLFGLHGKFVVSLLIAAALPFFAGLLFFEIMTFRLLVGEQGDVHQLESSALVAAVNLASNAEAEKILSWLSSGNQLLDFASEKSAGIKTLDPVAAEHQIRYIDEIWPSLPAADPKVRAVLANAASRSLGSYKAMHHEVAEIMVTDALGRVIASTSRSSDYNQANENWWRKASVMANGDYWRDTVQYDESTGLFVVNLVMPLYKDDEMVGVLKLAVEIAQLVPRLIMRSDDAEPSWAFVLRSGYILASSEQEVVPLRTRLPEEVMTVLRAGENGWCVGKGPLGSERIIGFSAFSSDDLEPNAYIVYSSLSDELFDPLWVNFIGTAVAGTLLLALCLLVGFFIIQRLVLRPLTRIEGAVRSLSMLMRLCRGETPDKDEILDQQQRVEAELRTIQKIRTGDQMELLAREISTMISRVMRYQYEVDKAAHEKERQPDD